MKIGIGITTWKRPELFNNLLNKLKDLDDRFVFSFVFDGNKSNWIQYDLNQIYKDFPQRHKVYTYYENVGVAKCKNKSIDLLNEFKDIDYYFLLDDDIDILDLSVFDKYIEMSQFTGLQHLMFLGIPPNKITTTVMYSETQGITINEHAQGAFMMFTKEHLEKIGKFDEKFCNALEHVDMTYRSYTSQNLPFWYFIDILGSAKLLKEISAESTITNKDKYQLNLQKSAIHWIEKYGKSVAETPRHGFTELIDRLKKIKDENFN
jgi:hypothetical protein